MKWYIGVDPGKKGAIAMVSHDACAIEYAPMPATVKGVVEMIANLRTAAKLNGYDVALVTELAQVMPGQGGVSGFTYGRGFGAPEVVCACLGIPYHEVRPGIWKKSLKVSAEKDTSIRECERLFPTVNLILPRCTKKHDGMAEALLVAEWGRRAGL